MKYTQFFIPTLREAPRDADIISAQLMIRAGMIRKLASGLYDWLPLGLRVLKKVEQIIREEMNQIQGQEVWLPHIQPRELWDETGRWNVYGKELLRIKDRKNSEFCFAPTAEEVITDLARRDVRSYRQLPVMFYQFGTKFRDEIRPRFGIMRAREFYMKDAYSFHADEKDAEQYYAQVYEAYQRIFKRCGLDFRPVEAESGAIGGSFSHEFMVLAETGEEEIISCSVCGYGANIEKAESLPSVVINKDSSFLDLEEISTPKVTSVNDVAKFMNAFSSQFIKTLFYMVDGLPVVVLMRGNSELNEFKLLKVLQAKEIFKMSEEKYSELAQCEVGFAGPVGLKARVLKSCISFKLVADHEIQNIKNGISGANKKDTHMKNINLDRDFSPDIFADLRKVQRGDFCVRCEKNGQKNLLQFSRGIEVGHTFKLGTKYSASMNATYLDSSGKSYPYIMGCYGIGVSRVLAASIEQKNDANGIIWGKNISPFHGVIIPVKMDDARTMEWTLEIEKELTAKGFEVLIDDRDERAGIKFKDADLIGIPLRITVGIKSMDLGQVEMKLRNQTDYFLVSKNQVVEEFIKQFNALSL